MSTATLSTTVPPSPAPVPPAAPPHAAPAPHATGPRTPAGKTEAGKAVAARNATTHGLFARDVVLPALGEDPQGYRLLEDAWLAQLPPRTLLEQHYVEKIAAASWRLRRLHRWQAQLFEDDTLTEEARLDRLDKALRHETHLHRQIDTAVKMLGRDAPALYARRVRDEVLEEAMTSERECRDSAREETDIDLETRGRLRRIRKATEAVVAALADAPLDTRAGSGPVPPRVAAPSLSATPWRSAEPVVPAPVPPAPPTDAAENCRNEPAFSPALLLTPGWAAPLLKPPPIRTNSLWTPSPACGGGAGGGG